MKFFQNSFNKNIISNYISQIYVACIGLLILPIYLKLLGAESYGLIGFFTMMQASFALLDLGLSSTISRETARFSAGAIQRLEYLRLYRALTILFILIAIFGSSLIWLNSWNIVNNWLNLQNLSDALVIEIIQIMSVVIAARWLCGLFRGVIVGFEKIVVLSVINIIFATLRFVCVLWIMSIFGYTIDIFFKFQLVVSLMELSCFFIASRLLLPSKKEIKVNLGWSIKPIKNILKFSLTIAFTAGVWVLITQVDKIILSGILPLSDYGYFSLAVMAASGITFLSSPIGTVIMPRLAGLFASGKIDELLNLYRRGTQIACIITGTATLTIFVHAEQVLFLWTGDITVVEKSSTILRLYALGYGFLAIGAFPYYLQYSYGNLKLHLIGNLIILLFMIPLVIFLSYKYGAIGAAIAWLSVHLLYLLIWTWYVHSKFIPNMHLTWIINDFAKPYLAMTLVSILFIPVISAFSNRLFILLLFVILSACMSLSGYFFSSLRLNGDTWK